MLGPNRYGISGANTNIREQEDSYIWYIGWLHYVVLAVWLLSTCDKDVQ